MTPIRLERPLMFAPLLLGAVWWAALAAADTPRPLVVHEWGTITTRHDADGTPATGLNRIDASEVLPDFVHRYEPPTTHFDPRKPFAKSPLVPGRPDVNLRLETPVIYFYPPAGTEYTPPIDIQVEFRGGVLNEFYPDAVPSISVDVPRVRDKMGAGVIRQWSFDVLNNYVRTKLQWQGLRLAKDVMPPNTDNPVWLAPRAVRATSVASPSGEGERYVFYRGVAHLDALMQTRLNAAGLKLSAPARTEWFPVPSISIARIWFADIRVNGTTAFQEHGAVKIQKGAGTPNLAVFRQFAQADYSVTRAQLLRQSMKRQLIASGLFDDEAEAMLNTWNVSYFQKPGLRVFYMVPKEWLDYFLPLQVSVPSQISRVMVGRIDFTE